MIPSSTTTEPCVSLAALALGFTKVVMLSFGGGLSAWSLLVIVEQRRWLTEDEFLSATTFCRMLPGPVQFNMAVYVGAKLRGFPGVIAALVGLLTIPFLIVLGLAIAYFNFHHVPEVRAALSGMTAASVGLTLSLGIKMGIKHRHRFSAVVLMTAAFVAVGLMRWPLVPVLAVLGPLGIYWNWPSGHSKEPTAP
jgi:chromate transporter